MNAQKVIDYFIEHEGKYLVVEEKVKLVEASYISGLLDLVFEYNKQTLFIPINVYSDYLIIEVPENLLVDETVYIDNEKTLSLKLTEVLNNWVKKVKFTTALSFTWSES